MKLNESMDREPLAIRAARILREQIMNGEYSPGQRLTEEDLARSLGVSRNVVREAFHSLESEGLVENHYYRGKSVVRLSPKDMADLVPLRVNLECLAVDLAVRNLTDAAIQDFEGIGRTFRKPDLSFTEFNEIDFELHRAIVQCSKNEHLARFLRQIWGPFFTISAHRNYLPQFSRDREQFQRQSVEYEMSGNRRGHQQIIKNICLRNSIEAQAAMRDHILLNWTEWANKQNLANDERFEGSKVGSSNL